MRVKKAEAVVSFSWIFMSIVGVFFIVISYNIITKYQETENEKFLLEFQQNLRVILNNVGRTTGLEENSIEPLGDFFKDAEVELSCFESIPILRVNELALTDNSFIRNYPTGLTFLSQGVVANSYLAVESFRLPFKTTNILSFVSDYNLIVFDNQSDISQEFLRKFSEESSYRNFYVLFDYSFDDLEPLLNRIAERRLSSLMFVSDFDRELPSGYRDLSYSYEIYHVQIKYDKEDISSSQIRYNFSNRNYQTSKIYNSIDYDNSLSLETLAIFSNPSAFDCAYNQIIENTKITYSFYLNKLEDIANLSKFSPLCSASQFSYADDGAFQGTQQFNRYVLLNTSLKAISEEILSNNFSNVDSLKSSLSELSSAYSSLERFNCYVIY